MAEAVTYQTIIKDIRKDKVAPVYLLHGEEGYYTDMIAKEIEALVDETERDFDLTVLYAPELDSPLSVATACRRYPMFAKRQVVIVKEVQTAGASFLNGLAAYAMEPEPLTVLCLCFRGQQARGAEFLKALRKGGGVNFESKKLNERNVGAIVAGFIKERGLTVDPKALTMLCDFVGTDLSRIDNEVNKLTVTLGRGAMITPEAVEQNIGISKDYNNFEFISAVANHNEAKVLTIVNYFRANPKNNPVQVISVVLFNFFANLLQIYYAADKTEHGLMQELGFRSPWQLKDYTAAQRYYGPWEVIEILSLIRRFDGASKGNGSRMNPYDLFFTLIFHILHPLGKSGVKLKP